MLKERLLSSEEERAGKLAEDGRFICDILLLAYKHYTQTYL